MTEKTAEAVKEVAKTTGLAIESINRLGGFFANVMGEPIDATCGMLTDKLKFRRWENQIKLVEKSEKIINDKGLSSNFMPISPKLTLPILHNASLEDDDQLHDLYAKLLVTAIDPNMQTKRTAFPEIIRQLESVDVKVLQIVYDIVEERNKARPPFFGENRPPNYFFAVKREVLNNLKINDSIYWESVDNLCRLGLIGAFPADKRSRATENSPFGIATNVETVTTYEGGYDKLSITALGVTFVKICNY